jgi:hypothetical protein
VTLPVLNEYNDLQVTALRGVNEINLDLIAATPELNLMRVPVVEGSVPSDDSLDILVQSLRNEPASTQCMFSCQMGRERTTIGK